MIRSFAFRASGPLIYRGQGYVAGFAPASGETGRVLPLDLVRVTEAAATWHGLCTAVRIAASRDNGALLVEQSITLERHFTDAD